MLPEGGDPIYSLWLIPGNPEFEKLDAIIKKNQSRTAQPFFIPHVTLLSRIVPVPDIKNAIRTLRDTTSTFAFRFQELKTGDDYFHCLYIPVKLSVELKMLRMQALQLCPTATTPPFQPHVSLMYCDPQSTLFKKSPKSLPDVSTWNPRFSKLELWNTKGPVDEWKFMLGVRLPPKKR